MKMIISAVITFVLILSGWWVIWPIYLWQTGEIPVGSFSSMMQQFYFILGIIIFVPTSLFGKKIHFG